MMGSSRRSGGGLRAGASSPMKSASKLMQLRRKATQSPDSGYFEFLLATQIRCSITYQPRPIADVPQWPPRAPLPGAAVGDHRGLGSLQNVASPLTLLARHT